MISTEKIRNVCVLAHSNAGKTSLCEAMLHKAGLIDRIGTTADGNTVSDFDPEEIKRKISVNASVIPIEWNDTKINFIDTPGYFDFIGEVNAALRAAEAAVIMVDAGAGIQVGTEAAWKACERYNRPRFIVINKRDKDEFDFYKTFGELKDRFGEKLVPFSWPLSVEIDEELKEAIASADDELMEKYFEGEDFTEEEVAFVLTAAKSKLPKVYLNEVKENSIVVYTKGFGGTILVEYTIADGSVTNIAITKSAESYDDHYNDIYSPSNGDPIKDFANNVLGNDNWENYNVSGATITSAALKDSYKFVLEYLAEEGK